MKRINVWICLAAMSLMFLTACDNGESRRVFISISPSTASVEVGRTTTLTVTAQNTDITWPTLSEAEGSYTVNGNEVRYTAPRVATEFNFTVTATADPEKTATVTIKAELPRIAILEIPAAQGAYSGWNGRWYSERSNEVRTSDVLRDLFVTEFLDQGAGKIRVMERAQLDAIRGEQAFGQSGEVDVSTAVQVGKLAGVRYMVTGKITRFAQRRETTSTGRLFGNIVGQATGNRTAGAVAGSIRVGRAGFDGRLDMRIIDVETGEIVAAVYDTGSRSNVSVRVAGVGNDVQYDDTMVSQVFESIVKRISQKLIAKLQDNVG